MFNGVWLVLLMIIFSCSEPDPRRPVSHHTDSFFEESVERNKNVNALEEAAIKFSNPKRSLDELRGEKPLFAFDTKLFKFFIIF